MENGGKWCHSRSSLCANLLEDCCPVELVSNCGIDQQRPGLEALMKRLAVVLSGVDGSRTSTMESTATPR